MTEDHVMQAGLSIARPLAAFVADEALPGTGIAPAQFWQGFAELRALLESRILAALPDRDIGGVAVAGRPGNGNPGRSEFCLRPLRP